MPPHPIKSPAIGPPWSTPVWVGLELKQGAANTYWVHSAFPTFFYDNPERPSTLLPFYRRENRDSRNHFAQVCPGMGRRQAEGSTSNFLQTRCSLGAASTNREKTCPSGEPPYLSCYISGCHRASSRTPQTPGPLPSRSWLPSMAEDRSSHQCVGHQRKHRKQRRGKSFSQGLPEAPLRLGKPLSLHPPHQWAGQKCWRGGSQRLTGRRCGGAGWVEKRPKDMARLQGSSIKWLVPGFPHFTPWDSGSVALLTFSSASFSDSAPLPAHPCLVPQIATDPPGQCRPAAWPGP